MINEYITLQEAKKHLNLDTYFTEDDTYIESLIDVCTVMVEKHIGVSLEERASEEGCLPPNIKHAILLLLGYYYGTREAAQHVQTYECPFAVNYLLQLEKNYDYS